MQGRCKHEQETHRSANLLGNVTPSQLSRTLNRIPTLVFRTKNPSGRAAVKRSGVKEAMKIGGRGKVVRRMQISLHPRVLVLHRVSVFVS